ncbi:MAG: peptidase S10 [Planctomycetes bacterium]|nr:peptidase S10 [Planctomycetota bacterium]
MTAFALACLVACLGVSSPRDDAPAPKPAPQAIALDSTHELALHDGRKLAYSMVGETLHLRNLADEVVAEFFAISYLADTASEAERVARPVTFAFNGGPGSSSIWLHLGLLGPKRVVVPSDAGHAGAPPFPLVDNPDSLLAVSDLVMVDPIDTGLSRVVGKGENGDHWGVDEDARSINRFIREWLAKHGRHGSPKYLLGESYGGIRAPLLVRELQGGHTPIALNGVILISPALDMALVDGQETDATYAVELPTFAATAWYHRALPEPPAELLPFLAEVATFVDDEYVPALFLGRELPEAQREALIAKLHRYTGLAPDYWRRANLRVSSDRFRRELLRGRGEVVGRLDSRYLGREPDAVGETPSGDPMFSGIGGAYAAAFQSYLHAEFGRFTEREYLVSSPQAGGEWKRPPAKAGVFHGYVDVMPELARGMEENRELRVFIASGLYDLATTAFAARHNVRRSTCDLERVVLADYPAGHMMYVHEPTLTALAGDLRNFIAQGK